MTREFELSRRKALAGLATIGAAGAGAGLGTSALFSDEATAEGNVLEAGTFDMEAHLLGASIDQDGGMDEGDWWAEETGEGGEIGYRIDVTDLKPGDSYEFCWCLTIRDNPGVARYYVDNVSSQTGAEAGNVDASDIHDIDSNDEFMGIAEHPGISATQQLFVCEAERGEEPGSLGEGDPGTALKEATEYDTFGGVDTDGSWLSSAQGGDPPADVGTPVGIHNGGAWWNDEDRQTDYVVIGANEDDETLDNADWASVALCVGIDVSPEVGNELQGATMSFDLVLKAEQLRHNANPFDLEYRPHVDEVDWANGPWPVDTQTSWL